MIQTAAENILKKQITRKKRRDSTTLSQPIIWHTKKIQKEIAQSRELNKKKRKARNIHEKIHMKQNISSKWKKSRH